MNNFGDTSGVSSNAGYDYQHLVAAYYLIVDNVREIEYEADGEDLTIINEDRSRESIEFIQVKKQSSGSFSLNNYRTNVFPQMWDAFIEATMRHENKGIFSTLLTDVSYGHDLKIFMDLCEKARTRGYRLSAFERNPVISRNYDLLKSGKDSDKLHLFLWGAKMVPSFTSEHIKHKIISFLKDCNVVEPQQKLALVKNYISEKGQGVITRNEIIGVIGSELIPIKETSSRSYGVADVKKLLINLKSVESKYSSQEEYPNTDNISRDMTRPVKHTADALLSFLNDNENSIVSSTQTKEDFREVIITDRDKAKEEAQLCADLEMELWAHRKRYSQKLTSMAQTAKEFGIDLSEDKS